MHDAEIYDIADDATSGNPCCDAECQTSVSGVYTTTHQETSEAECQTDPVRVLSQSEYDQTIEDAAKYAIAQCEAKSSQMAAACVAEHVAKLAMSPNSAIQRTDRLMAPKASKCKKQSLVLFLLLLS